MAFPPGCLDEPRVLLAERLCVHNVSKDLHGNLELNSHEEEKCGDPPCVTLKTVNRFKVEMKSHDCDSALGHQIDGTLVAESLVTAFESDGTQRGVYAGDFDWFPVVGGLIHGRLSGITNAGTHRTPIFDPCEQCHQINVFAGRLCGEVVEVPPNAPELKGAKVVALYKVFYDTSAIGGQGFVKGTLEGVVIVPCLG